MKVIFDKTFLSELSDRSNFLRITKYSLVRDWKEVSKVSDLFSETYVTGDVKSFREELSEALWETDSNLLRLCIDIPEDKKEDFIKNSYKFLYCYYKDSVSNNDKIAFILCNSSNIVELQFDDLELMVSKNLINIPFPKNTLATIKINQSDDTKFLEGLGVSAGVNIFNAIPNDTDLVSKKSYFTYYRNYKCNANNKLDLPYLNINGEKVSDISTYRVYSNFILEIPGINTNNYDTPTIDNLSVDGGVLQLYGTIDYEEFEVINGIDSFTKSGTLSINDLSALEIICKPTEYGDKLINYTTDIERKQFIYEKIDDPSTQAQGVISLAYSYNDPKTNSMITVESNSITLLQGEVDSDWQIESLTNFKEENTSLYVLDWRDNVSKQIFIINTNFLETPEINYENEDLFNDFFDIQLVDLPSEISGTRRISVQVITKQCNQSSSWYPVINENGEIISKLSWARIKIRNRIVQFYCIQRYEIKSLKLFKQVDSSFIEIDSIMFSNGTSDVITETIYPAKESSLDETSDSWVILSSDPEIDVNPITGELNDYDLKNQLLSSFNVISTVRPQTTSPKIYSNLILAKGDVDILNSDITDWRNYIKISTIEVPISRKGEDAYLEVPTRSISLSDINVYRFLVKSNCAFGCKYEDSSYSDLIDPTVRFYDTNKDVFESYSFDKTSGVYVYINYTRTMDESYKGKITVYSLDDPSCKSEINLNTTLPDPDINKIYPTVDYVFLPNEYSAKSEIKLTSTRSLSFNVYDNLNNITITTDTVFSRVEGGYLYHICNLSESSSPINYPIRRLSDITIHSDYDHRFGLSGEFANYSIYKKGNNPELKVSHDFIVIGNNPGDYFDVEIKTRYLLTDDDITADLFLLNSVKFKCELTYVRYDYKENMYVYKLRVITSITGSGSTDDNEYLGKINIKSFIKSTEFVVDETRWTQSFVNEMVPPALKTIDVYQGTVSGVGIVGDTSSVSIFGEDRLFHVIGINEDYEVRLSEISSGIFAEYSERKILTSIKSKFPESYKPYLVAKDNSYVNDFLAKDTVNSFKATIKNTLSSEIWSEKVILTQPGLSHGLLFRCPGVENTLYLSNNELNAISINVGSEVTEVSLCAGIFNISKELSIGDTGKGIKIKSTDSEESEYVYNIEDTARYSSSGDYNITIKFPKNTSISEKKRTFTIYGEGEDSSGIVHTMTFTVIQGENNWEVISSEGKDSKLIKAHSSGYIINDLTSFGYSIETNIPKDSLFIDSDLELKDVTAIEEGTSTAYGPDFKKISISFTIPENHTGELISGNLYIGYKDDSTSKVYWDGIIKQGYFTTILKSNDDINYYSGESIGTQEFPVDYPSKNSSIVPYKVEVVECEVTDSGELGKEIKIGENWGLIPSNDFGSGGKAYTWDVYSKGTLVNNGASIYLEKYETNLYVEHSNESLNARCPFIANEYITKEGYYEEELLIKVSIWLYAYYPEDNGILENETDRFVDNFSYDFWIRKVSALESEV